MLDLNKHSAWLAPLTALAGAFALGVASQTDGTIRTATYVAAGIALAGAAIHVGWRLAVFRRGLEDLERNFHKDADRRDEQLRLAKKAEADKREREGGF
ncbi:hypothetical protein [Azospirillum sp. SYSU D00513]|uniref:hypothetical protein n=1 Tax=Azospirillum sp. SYSU D00513 TaxID=2812561 RepID=UPI001A956BFD|nr:hypothetical protein [Azospirillum sp. SYSU D00513]